MIAKSREQVVRVVRSRRRLRMILDAEDRLTHDLEPFVRVIEQVLVRDRDARRQRLDIDDEPVVLRRDLDLTRRLVEDGMVPAVMTERELLGPAAERQAEDLMAEADAE